LAAAALSRDRRQQGKISISLPEFGLL